MKGTFTQNAFLLLLLFFWSAGHIIAQDAGAGLSGTVKDQQGMPLSNVHVKLEGTSRVTTTDVKGHYRFSNLNPGQYDLQLSAIGYKTQRQPISLEAGRMEELNFSIAEDIYAIPQVTIIDSKDRLISKLPGSASYIDQKEIQRLQPVSGDEVLRRVPGVHVVQEEGVGLRANIGIRGLDPNRSRSVLVLEDGVPVALNPYGEPELYFTPSIDRMQAVEVVKGSGQILYGPQTIGGVINYITAAPPESSQTRVRMQGGQGGFFSGFLSYGNTFGNTGVQVDLLRKQADNLGPTSFALTDFNTRLKLQLSERSKLGIKLGAYNETSNSTYVGLTQTMYDAGGQDFTRVAPDDKLQVSRYLLSANHEYTISPDLQFLTTAFAYTIDRNWRRQDFSHDPTASRQTGVVWGDESVPGGAIYMREGTGNRDRQFAVAGVEPRIRYKYQLGSGKESELITGVRLMHERALEQRVNGSFPQAVSGNLVHDEMRNGNAFSAYAQNKLGLSDKLSLSMGLRYELYDFGREIYRNNFAGTVKDTLIVGGDMTHQLIPGAGFNYKASQYLNLFGGIHRGFAPPRVKDAITAEGETQELDAELSWNYELGLRTAFHKSLFVELTAFRMDFSNQIIPVAESAGGTGAGLINAGRTLHQGLELGTQFAIHELFETAYIINYDINATWIHSVFNEDRFKGEENLEGRRTPYAPEYIASSALTVEAPFGLGLRLTGTFVGHQFTDELNTVTPSVDGRIGELPAYGILDATLQYHLPKINSLFNVSVKNLTNERFIASRRPQGIIVGLPRFITAGFEVKF